MQTKTKNASIKINQIEFLAPSAAYTLDFNFFDIGAQHPRAGRQTTKQQTSIAERPGGLGKYLFFDRFDHPDWGLRARERETERDRERGKMATQAIQQKIVTKVGVVVAAHRCAQTVKVRVARTVKDKYIRKVWSVCV